MSGECDICGSYQHTESYHPQISAKHYERLRFALKVIHTWATYKNGETLNSRDVAKLTSRVLGIAKHKPVKASIKNKKVTA